MNCLALPVLLAIATPAELPDGTMPDYYYKNQMQFADECQRRLPKSDPCKGLLARIRVAQDCRISDTPEEAREKERAILLEFQKMDYGRLPISVHGATVDFDVRERCVAAIANYEIVGSDTNALYAAADNLSRAVELSVAERDADLAAIHSVLRHLYYTPERIACNEECFRKTGMRGALKAGPHFRMYWECLAEYNARSHYNALLQEFRAAALGSFYAAIMNGYSGSTDGERRAIWDEFCRRANASEGERDAAENLETQSPRPNHG